MRLGGGGGGMRYWGTDSVRTGVIAHRWKCRHTYLSITSPYAPLFTCKFATRKPKRYRLATCPRLPGPTMDLPVLAVAGSRLAASSLSNCGCLAVHRCALQSMRDWSGALAIELGLDV
mgnify:CR=1 FL=1